MEPRNGTSPHLVEPPELIGFKQITGQLMTNLQKGDIEKALQCINEINQINDKSTFTIVGKITRGLYNAISDLHIPTDLDGASSKNRTRAGLNYVIELTDGATRTTLDKTEHTRDCVGRINTNLEQQAALMETLRAAPDAEHRENLLSDLDRLLDENKTDMNSISRNVSEIVVAQNFQDLASQSIRKAITIISDVESSLVMLTQYTKVLQQLSQFPSQEGVLDEKETQELRSNLEQMDIGGDNEHMDQNDVDNLLSSLGF
jgi:chemotaxis protein CheZ